MQDEIVLFSESKTKPNNMNKDHHHGHHYGMYAFEALVLVGIVLVIYLQVKILKKR